jgi:hypothetical protein
MSNRAVNPSLFFRIALMLACAGAMVVAVGRRRAATFHSAAPQSRPRDPLRESRRRSAAPTREEWEQARTFLQLHSPNRLKQFMNLRFPQAQERVQWVLMNRYRNLMRLKSLSPDLYDVKVQEVELEDEVFGICLKIKSSQGDTEALRASLKPKLAALFDKGIEERQLRIGMLEKTLARQKEQLSKEQSARDQRIEQQYKRVAAHGVEGAIFGASRAQQPRPGSRPSTSAASGQSPVTGPPPPDAAPDSL